MSDILAEALPPGCLKQVIPLEWNLRCGGQEAVPVMWAEGFGALRTGLLSSSAASGPSSVFPVPGSQFQVASPLFSPDMQHSSWA